MKTLKAEQKTFVAGLWLNGLLDQIMSPYSYSSQFYVQKQYCVFKKNVIKDTMLAVKCTGALLIIRAHFQDLKALGFI